MEKVEIDPDRGVVIMHLAPKNRVRLTPLLARITQGGTKILATKVEARGVIESLQQGLGRSRQQGLTRPTVSHWKAKRRERIPN